MRQAALCILSVGCLMACAAAESGKEKTVYRKADQHKASLEWLRGLGSAGPPPRSGDTR